VLCAPIDLGARLWILCPGVGRDGLGHLFLPSVVGRLPLSSCGGSLYGICQIGKVIVSPSRNDIFIASVIHTYFVTCFILVSIDDFAYSCDTSSLDGTYILILCANWCVRETIIVDVLIYGLLFLS
jgi:hypothetical protein